MLRRKDSAQQRDPRWDNVRCLCATLVVINHLTDRLTDAALLDWMYFACWPMRVPAFCLIAGWFSHAGPLTVRDLRRVIESILLPYVVIGVIATLLIRLFEGHWQWHTWMPAWGTWFLLSLVFWRVLLPYLAQLRVPLVIAVIGALAAGYVDGLGRELSAARTLTFLPFFVLGWKLRQGFADRLLRGRVTLIVAWSVIAGGLLITAMVHDQLPRQWFSMAGPYPDRPPPAQLAWSIRLAVLLVGAVGALALIRVVPGRRIPIWTYLGAGGMYIYLLHPLLLRPFLKRIGVDWADSPPSQLLVVLIGIAIAALLGSPPIRRITRPIIQPRVPWLFRPAPSPDAVGAASATPAQQVPHRTDGR